MRSGAAHLPPPPPPRSVPGQAWVPLPMQRDFLACSAFECFAGGAAGPGKSEALVVAPLRWVGHPGFRAVLFRNSFPELKRSLMLKADALYPAAGGTYRAQDHIWTFPGPDGRPGATVELAYLEADRDVYRYQGAEFSFVGFDELPHFTEFSVRYMTSRLRSPHADLPVRLRSTGNPDGPHLEWVRARYADWIEGRAPMGSVLWYDRDGKRAARGAPGALSRCYIPGKLSENVYLGAEYRAQLDALDPVTRARLLDGDWDAGFGEGKLFHRSWWPMFDRVPEDVEASCRAWDLGATADGDPTRGVLLHRRPFGVTPRYVVADVVTVRGPPGEVSRVIHATAAADGTGVAVCLPQDPGQAGIAQVQALAAGLAGYRVEVRRPSAAKVVRWGPVASQAFARNVALVRGGWVGPFVQELHGVPDGPHDDQADALADAFDVLVNAVESTERAARAGRRR